MTRNRHRYMTLTERVLAGVIRESPTECWLWDGKRKAKGYGVLHYEKREVMAHRVMWEISFGAIPHGACVLHQCDNPPCCNPAHLFLGTITDNNRDMVAKGRHARQGSNRKPSEWARGTQIVSSKLAPESVIEMRRRLADGEKLTAVARAFSVHKATVWAIRERRNWAWL